MFRTASHLASRGAKRHFSFHCSPRAVPKQRRGHGHQKLALSGAEGKSGQNVDQRSRSAGAALRPTFESTPNLTAPAAASLSPSTTWTAAPASENRLTSPADARRSGALLAGRASQRVP